MQTASVGFPRNKPLWSCVVINPIFALSSDAGISSALLLLFHEDSPCRESFGAYPILFRQPCVFILQHLHKIFWGQIHLASREAHSDVSPNFLYNLSRSKHFA